jgi:hypothetical protein
MDNFEIVWLAERSRQDLLQDQHHSDQILSLKEYCLRFFEDEIECWEYLRKLPTHTKVILLIQEQFADDAIPAFHSLCPIKFIFIVHPIASNIDHRNDLSKYVKVSLLD